MSEAVAVAPRGPTWFGQPKGLTILFLTQMWEQFSYYGMRALLIYYMTRELLLGQEKASLIYGAYMATGHFMMSFDALLYVALVTIALGNGLFLPSLPSQINDLYEAGDPKRGRAYNIYYVGINIGGFLAPLICGTLGEMYGWHAGFAAAGVGMLAGLAIYLGGGAYLPDQELPRQSEPLPHEASAAHPGTLHQHSASPDSADAASRPPTAFRHSS